MVVFRRAQSQELEIDFEQELDKIEEDFHDELWDSPEAQVVREAEERPEESSHRLKVKRSRLKEAAEASKKARVAHVLSQQDMDIGILLAAVPADQQQDVCVDKLVTCEDCRAPFAACNLSPSKPVWERSPAKKKETKFSKHQTCLGNGSGSNSSSSGSIDKANTKTDGKIDGTNYIKKDPKVRWFSNFP